MLALTGGKIYTMCGTAIEEGTVLIHNGKIVAVGIDVDIPSDCQVVDVSGKIVTPGIIDAHTHLGVYSESLAWSGEDVNEESQPLTPGIDVLDALNPRDIGIEEAYRGGITTVMVAPGSANPIGGQCIIIKTQPRDTADEMILCHNAGLKIAFGENPRRSYGNNKKMPVTRMATANMIRETFIKARRYMQKNGEEDFEYDLGMEAVAKVLRREMPLRAHAHRADDIVTAIRLAKEFHADIIIEHATEAHLIPDVISKANVPLVLGPHLVTRVKMELKDKNMANCAIMAKAGVKFAIMSDHPVLPSCFLPVYAGLASRFGLDKEEALKAITIDAAEILGIDNQVGTIAPEKDADIVVWSDHPLVLDAKPEIVIVNGRMEKICVE